MFSQRKVAQQLKRVIFTKNIHRCFNLKCKFKKNINKRKCNLNKNTCLLGFQF